jgi:hypothetical protein
MGFTEVQIVEHDPQVLLVLLALRMEGGQAPASGDILKGLKNGVKLARERGFVTDSTVSMPSTNKAGKTTMKKTSVVAMSEQGEAYLRQAASADVLATTGAGHLKALQKSLEADRLFLREEILKSVAPKGSKAKSNLEKEWPGLAKAVEELRKRLEKVESALQNQGQESALERIDQAFASLQRRLEATLASHPAQTAHQPPQMPVSEPLQSQLQKAYQKLCQFVEFEDGLVEIPRLFHEARRSRPDLTIDAFHRELERLWSQRTLELKVLNEVRSASEPDKGIRRGDNLYYFVYWPSP